MKKALARQALHSATPSLIYSNLFRIFRLQGQRKVWVPVFLGSGQTLICQRLAFKAIKTEKKTIEKFNESAILRRKFSTFREQF